MKIENTIDCLNSNSSEIFHCEVCKEDKEMSCFHTYSHSVNGIKLRERCFNLICKDCLPTEAIQWLDHRKEPRINKTLVAKTYQNKQIKALEDKLGMKIDELVTCAEAVKILFLDSNTKHWINDKVRMKIIKEFKIRMTPECLMRSDFESKVPYWKYYLKEDIEILKTIRNNGFLICRGQKSIKSGNLGKHNPPYQFINENNKQFLFVNTTEHKKTCVRCCEYKDFDAFHGGITKDGYSNICIPCTQPISKLRYDSMEKREQKELSKRNMQWARANKDKVKLYRKIRNGKIEYRIIKNLRNRIKRLISPLKYPHVCDYRKQYHLRDKGIGWLGCNYSELISYIESKFLPGMTWQNYGVGYETDENGNTVYDEFGNIKRLKQWQIDHIKCVSSFNLNDQQEIERINHYTNLIPMWSDDNNWKRNKTELCPILDKEFLEKYKELEVLIKKKHENIKEM